MDVTPVGYLSWIPHALTKLFCRLPLGDILVSSNVHLKQLKDFNEGQVWLMRVVVRILGVIPRLLLLEHFWIFWWLHRSNRLLCLNV